MTSVRTAVGRIEPPPRTPAPHRRESGRRRRRRENLYGYVFLSPWLLGFLAITAIPMLLSLYLSFTDYDVLTPLSDVNWVGWANYKRMFTADPSYWHAVKVTLMFALIAVPLKLGAALGVALLLNRTVRGIGWFRGLFYLPSLLGGSVALAIVWRSMFNREGAFNSFLAIFGIEGLPWVNDPDWALSTLILLAVWQFGAPMVIFLAGLKQIPQELYEAAEVDGAGPWHKFRNVTIPMLSSVIFFNLLLELINAFQVFASAYIISNGSGGPAGMTNFYTLYLYKRGFADLQMGYASAMAWVLVIVVAIIAFILFKTQKSWVHYAGENR